MQIGSGSIFRLRGCKFSRRPARPLAGYKKEILLREFNVEFISARREQAGCRSRGYQKLSEDFSPGRRGNFSRGPAETKDFFATDASRLPSHAKYLCVRRIPVARESIGPSFRVEILAPDILGESSGAEFAVADAALRGTLPSRAID